MSRSIAAVLMWSLAAASAWAQPPATLEGPVVITAGQGIVKRTPDRAWVSITAESRARSPREAQRLNADAMAAVMQNLKGTGIPPDALKTSSYDLQPEFDYANGRQTLRGYVARNSVEVRVDELPRVGELLDLAVGAGATSVSGVRFDLKDRVGAEREALRQAVADARARADAAASGAGMRVERVLRIEEQRTGPVPPPRPMVMAMRAEAGQAAAEPPISAGEIEIHASVTLTAAVR